MNPETLEEAATQVHLANLTPGEAVECEVYETYLEAVKVAPALAMALLDHAHEADCARAFATARCEDWHAIAQALRLENDVLWTRVHAAEGRHRQNERIRQMWHEERERKDRPELHDRVDELAREARELKRQSNRYSEIYDRAQSEIARLRKLVPYELRFASPETNDSIFDRTEVPV